MSETPIIVDITAQLSFPDKPSAARTAAWIRARYDGSAVVGRVGGLRTASEWAVEARIPRTRFDLEGIRPLLADLMGLAEQEGGALVSWDATRPREGQRGILRQIRAREVAIVSFDVALVALGVALQAVVLVAAAAVAALVEGGIWLAAGRTSARH